MNEPLVGAAGAKQKGMINLNAKGEGASVSTSGSAKLLDSRRKGAVFLSPGQIQYEAPPLRIRASGKMRINAP
jgi:hypothetical protein